WPDRWRFALDVDVSHDHLGVCALHDGVGKDCSLYSTLNNDSMRSCMLMPRLASSLTYGSAGTAWSGVKTPGLRVRPVTCSCPVSERENPVVRSIAEMPFTSSK